MAVPKKVEIEIMEVLGKFTKTMLEDFGHEEDKTLQYMKTVIDSILPKKEDVADIKECKKVEFTFTDFLMYEDILHVSGCDTATNTEDVAHVSRCETAMNTEDVDHVSTDVLPYVVVVSNSVSSSVEKNVETVPDNSRFENIPDNIAPTTPEISPARVQNTNMCSNTRISPHQSNSCATKMKGEYTVHEMSDLEEYFEYSYKTLEFDYNNDHLKSHVKHDPSQQPKKSEGFYIKNNDELIFVNISCMYGLVPFIYNYSNSGNIAGDVYMSLAILKKNRDIFRIMFPNLKIDTLIKNMTKNPNQKFFLKPDVLDKMTLLLQFAYDKVPTLPMFVQN
jgi:hypothetical protein